MKMFLVYLKPDSMIESQMKINEVAIEKLIARLSELQTKLSETNKKEIVEMDIVATNYEDYLTRKLKAEEDGYKVSADLYLANKKREEENERQRLEELKKVPYMTLQNWIEYYEKIEDYSTAWLLKENELRNRYVNLTEEQFQQLASIAKTEYFDKLKTENETVVNEVAEKTKTLTDQIGDYFNDSFNDRFASALVSGKASFKDFANSVIADIAKIIAKMYIVNPLVDGIKDLLSGGGSDSTYVDGWASGVLRNAKGGVFQNGVKQRFAQGGILNRPTRLAGGGALAGEKGAEAIMPLTRTRNGRFRGSS